MKQVVRRDKCPNQAKEQMESAGKRKWKKEIEESSTGKGMKMAPAANRSGGTSSSNKQKGKAQVQAHAPATTKITLQNIAFEGLSSMECRKW